MCTLWSRAWAICLHISVLCLIFSLTRMTYAPCLKKLARKCEKLIDVLSIIYYNKKTSFVLKCDISNKFMENARGVRMRVSYNKLWKLLIDKKMSKADLRKAVDIAPNTLTKMRKDGEVSMSVLLKIATYLDCDISDICEFVKDEEN